LAIYCVALAYFYMQSFCGFSDSGETWCKWHTAVGETIFIGLGTLGGNDYRLMALILFLNFAIVFAIGAFVGKTINQGGKKKS